MNPTPIIVQYQHGGQRRVGGSSTVHIVDKDGFARMIDEMILLGTKNREIMRIIGARLRAMQHEHFEAQEDISGTAWPPLSAATIAARMPRARRAAARTIRSEFKSRGFSTRGIDIMGQAKELVWNMGGFPMLRDTGRLQNSIQMAFDDDSTRVGTNVVYAPHHQFGAPAANIPQRMFLYCNDAEAQELVDMLADKRIRAALMGVHA
jgi:phage gpG-like protein